MYEDQEKKMLQMQRDMDRKQVFTFSEKLRLSNMRREMEMRRKIIAAIKTIKQETFCLLAALGVLTIESLIVVPPLVRTRGYLAFGGEWFAMIGLAIIFWLWIRERYEQ